MPAVRSGSRATAITSSTKSASLRTSSGAGASASSSSASSPGDSAFIRRLAANDRPTRDAAVLSLRSFLSARRVFPLVELRKLWRGLFYCYWHSDRVPVQLQLAADLANLTLLLDPRNLNSWWRACYDTLATQWPALDKWRIDKYYALQRRIARAAFTRLRSDNWPRDVVEEYVQLLEEGPLDAGDPKKPAGLQLHLADVWVEELAAELRSSGSTPQADARRSKGKSRSGNTAAEEEVDLAELAKDVPVALLIRPFDKLARHCAKKSVRERARREVVERVETLQMLGRQLPDAALPAPAADATIAEDGAAGDDDSETSFAGFD